MARDQIETIVESPTSPMPENLLFPLKPQELPTYSPTCKASR